MPALTPLSVNRVSRVVPLAASRFKTCFLLVSENRQSDNELCNVAQTAAEVSMLFLVELDHVESGSMLSYEAGRAFIEQIILPTIARAEQLATDKKIVAGGAVAGRVALRFVMEAESVPEIDRLISGLPLWPLAETHVTPLVALTERRKSVEALAARLDAESRPK